MELEERLLMLFKFGRKENLEKLQKGQLYCKSAEYYNKYELENNNKSIGDIYDSHDVAKGVDIYLIEPNTNVLLYKAKGTSDIVDTELIKHPIFCCTGLTTINEHFKKVDEDNKKITIECKCSELFKDFLNKEYWDYCLMIPSHKLLTSLENKCKENDIHYIHNKVKYYNPLKTPIDKEIDIQTNPDNQTFWKIADSYEGQYEFRILFKDIELKNYETDCYILQLDDLTSETTLLSTNQLSQLILRIDLMKQ